MSYFAAANRGVLSGKYCLHRRMEAVFMRGRVEICGINTAKLPVLRHEENMALLRRVNAVDTL